MVLCFKVQEHPKAQSAMILWFKGHGLKSHLTDWESR